MLCDNCKKEASARQDSMIRILTVCDMSTSDGVAMQEAERLAVKKYGRVTGLREYRRDRMGTNSYRYFTAALA